MVLGEQFLASSAAAEHTHPPGAETLPPWRNCAVRSSEGRADKEEITAQARLFLPEPGVPQPWKYKELVPDVASCL